MLKPSGSFDGMIPFRTQGLNKWNDNQSYYWKLPKDGFCGETMDMSTPVITVKHVLYDFLMSHSFDLSLFAW